MRRLPRWPTSRAPRASRSLSTRPSRRNQWVQDILPLLRVSAGGEGKRVRADGATGGVVSQLPRFPALLSNTAMPELQQADSSRFTVVALGDPVDRWPEIKAGILSAMRGNAAAVRNRIIRRAPDIVRAIGEFADELETAGQDSREAVMSAALTLGWREWQVGTESVYSHDGFNTEAPDAERAFLKTSSREIRLPSGFNVTVLQALRSPNAEAASSVADLHGIKLSRPERDQRAGRRTRDPTDPTQASRNC